MSINIETFILGPIHNNTYLVSDLESSQAIVIDPTYKSENVRNKIQSQSLSLAAIWLTHGHFDHFAGAAFLSQTSQPPVKIGLHPDDMEMLRSGGGAQTFGFEIDNGFTPEIEFCHGQNFILGKSIFEVRHTPGHSRGHVIFYCKEAGVAFCGDLIFKKSVGRSDLPGGDWSALLESIRSQIFTLPPETRLLSGHGPETSVKAEMQDNPFIDG
jgi:hydroxyacylglutathione hydrolase